MNILILGVIIVIIIVFILAEREYDYKNKDRVVDLLPWAYGLKNGLIINKNGSVMKVFKFTGKDLDSSRDIDFLSLRKNLNLILKKLGEGYVINVEARRERTNTYPEITWDKELLMEMDKSRQEKNLKGKYFKSSYYISVSKFFSKDKEEKVKSFFKEKIEDKENRYEEEKKDFEDKMRELEEAFKEEFKEINMLDIEDTLKFLHSSISNKNQNIKFIGEGILLDNYISDTDITPGLKVKLGDKTLGIISVLSYPDFTEISMLDKLNKLAIEYRWTSRFIFYSKEKSLKKIEEYRKHFFVERKSFLTSFLEKNLEEDLENENLGNIEKQQEADYFKKEIEDEYVLAGEYTFTIILKNSDEKKLQEDMIKIENILNQEGLTTVRESLNSLESLIGSMAGDIEHNRRKDIIHTMNYIDLIPVSADWNGNDNKDFKEKGFGSLPLLYAESGENSESSFKLNLHVGDVGHTAIFGPTGAGKSVLLGTFAYQFMKYKNSQVVFFDKDTSSRVLSYAIGGDLFDIGKDIKGFQPLLNIDIDSELEWANDWLENILEKEGVKLVTSNKKALLEALKAIRTLPKNQRTITSLYLQLQDMELKDVLEKYQKGNIYGKYFDNDKETLEIKNRFQVFEMGALFNSPKIMEPVLDYIFHKLEKDIFIGHPTLLILDECWLMLDNPSFSLKIKEWLKTLRKKNVAVVFATQQISDVEKSSIKDVIRENCLTKIYLPNKEALSSDYYKKIYESFGLNEKELDLIKNGVMKRDYYYKSQNGSKMFKLGLSKLELAFIGSSTSEDQAKAVELYFEVAENDEVFSELWKNYKGLN